MSTAPSMPASVPVDLLPASAHRLRWDMGDVLRRLDASTAIEQARDHAVHLLRLQLGVLPYNSRRLSARRAVPLQQYVAATITRHHPEAP
ncbi:hypothetical protein ABFU49_09165 [Xanthomonas campestris pv. campestris]|uniref:hypothetical protein n=1 Tax=Xanthomonas campestris TaxID=339 RepID=UPI002163E575|nr:hypothetical protein [Xanthomonas campestris]MDM7714096.1 hypothetical protein [Xanthomonas campestris pv. campestris]MDO0846720.1 hypothetical protein [Xanthomonas campestris pv. campestris]MEA0925829.1 hypothetical protein [Xanthomonas campestris pv. campestris]MEA9843600.1 hypothetical protein [Xanthomonas campestris pv. raphani]MEB1359522.1 hypothetical protein [Xanthomonas campestris pv. campestris]